MRGCDAGRSTGRTRPTGCTPDTWSSAGPAEPQRADPEPGRRGRDEQPHHGPRPRAGMVGVARDLLRPGRGDPPARIARARVLGADIRAARPGGHRDVRRGPRARRSTRLGPRRRRARAPRRQHPGQQPGSGQRRQATGPLPPMRRHDDRAPPADVVNDPCQVSSVTGCTAPAADPPAAPGRAGTRAVQVVSAGCGRLGHRLKGHMRAGPRTGYYACPPLVDCPSYRPHGIGNLYGLARR